MDYQTTIQKEFRVTGPGLHTGRTVTVTVKPAFEDFGIAFRRAGWIYATIIIFVLMAILVFVLDFMGLLHQRAPLIARMIWSYGVPLLSIPFTYLAYRSFCRAQIVTHKFVTL